MDEDNLRHYYLCHSIAYFCQVSLLICLMLSWRNWLHFILALILSSHNCSVLIKEAYHNGRSTEQTLSFVVDTITQSLDAHWVVYAAFST